MSTLGQNRSLFVCEPTQHSYYRSTATDLQYILREVIYVPFYTSHARSTYHTQLAKIESFDEKKKTLIAEVKLLIFIKVAPQGSIKHLPRVFLFRFAALQGNGRAHRCSGYRGII